MSKKGDYGLVFLTALARNHSHYHYSSLKQIAKDNNLPYKFLSQIASQLSSAGLVDSKEGVGGGYRLAHDPQTINVAQAVQALEGPVAPVGCLRGKSCRCRKACGHKTVMQQLAQVMIQTMSSYSLSDLATSSKSC